MNRKNAQTSPPLAGIRVLDLSRILAGPYCTQFLADLGAEVIKVERPGCGDDTRSWGPPFAGGESAYFLSCNRNKKSIAIDLAREKGRELVRRLAQRCDILVENFKVGSMQRWGLDYERLREHNPRLIYCSISSYGQNSPDAREPGYDFIIQARGGIMSITGPEEGPPYKVGVAITDITAGLYAAGSILAALHHRERTGVGQVIDISLLDAQVSWLANVGMNYLVSGQIPRRYGNAHPNIVPYEVFPTADGYLAVAAANDAQFRRLCEVLRLDGLADRPEFATNAVRVQNRDRLIPVLQKAFSQKSSREWHQLLKKANIASSPIQNVKEVFEDPVVQARGMKTQVDHPTAGILNLIGPVPKFSHSPTASPAPPPLLGQHTDEVLQRLLQLDALAIQELREQKIVE
ncbi:MAG: CaiB/BaiF CoA-transferase family protein [candidate division KSB1 bacterium]|nr:CaiB/BaiF CoA-transferase family protein [candidate division KSB1 bacterium]